MIALFSALLGFLSSAAPEFIKLLTDHRDRAHEITLLKLQMEYDEKKLALARETEEIERAARLQEIQIEADVKESVALNTRPGTAGNTIGILWVDALAGSVRPMITYAFFVLYFTIKYCQFTLLLNPALPWLAATTPAQALVSLWTEEDIAIFSAVIGFWFGHRTMVKAKRL